MEPIDWSQRPHRRLQQLPKLMASHIRSLNSSNTQSRGAVVLPSIKGCKAHDSIRLNNPLVNHQEPFNNLDHHLQQRMNKQPPHHNQLNNILAACMQGDLPPSTCTLNGPAHNGSILSQSYLLQNQASPGIGLDGNFEYNFTMQPAGPNSSIIPGSIADCKSNQCHQPSVGADMRLAKDGARSRSSPSHDATSNRISKVSSTFSPNEIMQSNGVAGLSPTRMGAPLPVTPHNDTFSVSDAKLSSSWLSSGGSQDLSAEEKEMLYRAAAMQPISDVNPACSIASIETEVDKPKPRRNVRISKDPQSVAARQRRQRISSKMRVLQKLVPGGIKMDTASMLEEAAHYLKFLKAEVERMEAIEQLMNVAKGHFDSKYGPQGQTISKGVHTFIPHHGINVNPTSSQSSLLCSYPPSSVQAPHNNYLSQASLSF